jgi:hypothetical protein
MGNVSETIINEFLRRLASDLEAGQDLPLKAYQDAFPGFDALIAAE